MPGVLKLKRAQSYLRKKGYRYAQNKYSKVSVVEHVLRNKNELYSKAEILQFIEPVLNRKLKSIHTLSNL